MNFWKRQSFKLREKQLFFILLVLLLPCLIVSVFVQKVYVQEMDSYILSAARERSVQTQQKFEQIFDDIYNISDILALNDDLENKPSVNEYTKVNDIKILLDTLRVNQQCLKNIIILQDGSDYLISATGTYQKKNFYSLYVAENVPIDDFYDLIRDGSMSLLNAKSPYGDSWIFVTSIYRAKQKTYVLFLISKKELQNILSQYLTDGTGSLFVRDQKGTVLAQYSNDLNYSRERYDGIVSLCRMENDIVKLDGNKYVVSSGGFSKYGLETVSIVTGDSLSMRARTQNSLFLLTLVIALIIGLVMVIQLRSAIYQPLYSIISKVKKASGEKYDSAADATAYEAISSGIDYLEQEKRQMSSQIESHRQYLIDRLLSNRIREHGELGQLCSTFGWDMQRDAFYVCLVQTTGDCSGEELADYLQTVQMRRFRFFVKEMYQKGYFTVIWSMSKEESLAIEEQLELVRNGDSRILKVIGCDACCSLNEMPETFIRLVAEEGQNVVLPVEACRKIRELIENNDWEKASDAMDELISQIKEPKQLRYLSLSTALVMAESANSAYHGDVFELAKTDSMASCRNYLNNAMALIHENARVGEKQQEQEVPLITKMIRYLDVKYCDPIFSIQEMADHFGMSMPSLSKFFHEKQGMSLNEYVTEMKINRAKFLLENTDKSAATISQELGYTNAGSFGRRFRQITGTSPLEYRRQYLLNKEDNLNDKFS